MTGKRPDERIPKNMVCPKCGHRCVCRGTRRVLLEDGSEMRIRYRYCTVDGCDGAIKSSEMIEFE